MSDTNEKSIIFALIVEDGHDFGSAGNLTDEQIERVEALAKEIQFIFGEQAVEE